MNKIILYKTITGATGLYAKWLQKSINSNIKKYNELIFFKWDDYDMVIVMSGTYAGWMPMVNFLRRNWEKIKDKEVIAIGVGGDPVESKSSKEAYMKIDSEIRKKIKYFKLPGKFYQDKSIKVEKDNLREVIEYIKSKK